MITNLENLDKVLKILSKSLKKKFPFLGNISVSKIKEDYGVINIDIDVDFNKFISDNDLKLRSSLFELFKYYDNHEEIEKYISTPQGFLRIMIDDSLPNESHFGYKFNNKIEEYLSQMLEMLPDNLIPMHEYESFGDMRSYPVSFNIHHFLPHFDYDKYLKDNPNSQSENF